MSNVAVVWGAGVGLIPESALDVRVGYLQAYLITGKFLALFSLLFGVSFGLYLRRAQGQLHSIIPRYLRQRTVGCIPEQEQDHSQHRVRHQDVSAEQHGIALLWVAGGRARAVLALLGPAGRMALTNYLSVSFAITVVVLTTHTYGRVSVTVASVVGVLFWLMQVAWSTWWLRRHDFGPFEWLWRRLAYGPRWPVLARAT